MARFRSVAVLVICAIIVVMSSSSTTMQVRLLLHRRLLLLCKQLEECPWVEEFGGWKLGKLGRVLIIDMDLCESLFFKLLWVGALLISYSWSAGEAFFGVSFFTFSTNTSTPSNDFRVCVCVCVCFFFFSWLPWLFIVYCFWQINYMASIDLILGVAERVKGPWKSILEEVAEEWERKLGFNLPQKSGFNLGISFFLFFFNLVFFFLIFWVYLFLRVFWTF